MNRGLSFVVFKAGTGSRFASFKSFFVWGLSFGVYPLALTANSPVLANACPSTLLATIALPPVLTDATHSTPLAQTALPPVLALGPLLVWLHSVMCCGRNFGNFQESYQYRDSPLSRTVLIIGFQPQSGSA